jgi:glycosyltransferase involved in cell wall biosynthesis
MKISVITINYNNAVGLEKTIKSVLSQSYQDFEYIVIDGGSADKSKEIIEEYADKIDYWVSEPDKGIYNAMNKGISQAKGVFYHFLNSGDAYASDDVLDQIFTGKQYSVSILRGIQICDCKAQTFRWNNFGDRDVTLYDLYIDGLRHQATFIKWELFAKYGLYDESYRFVSDWKLFLQAIIDGEETLFLDMDIVIFDMNGISNRPEHQKALFEERDLVIKELLPETIRYDYDRLVKQDQQNREDAPYYYIIDLVKRNRFPYFCIRVLNKIYKTFKS